MNHFCVLLLVFFFEQKEEKNTQRNSSTIVSHCFGIYLLHSRTHIHHSQRLCVCVVVVHFTSLHFTTPPTPINYGMLVSFTVISSVFIEIYSTRFDSIWFDLIQWMSTQNVRYFELFFFAPLFLITTYPSVLLHRRKTLPTGTFGQTLFRI